MSKKAILWAVRIAFTVLLFLLIFRPEWFGVRNPRFQVKIADVLAAIRNVRLSVFLPWFAAGAAIKLCGILCSILRWRLLLLGQGIRMNFWHLVGSFLVGRFAGFFTPGTIGLDGYRLYDVGRYTGKWIESATVIAVEKLIGFIALTFLVFVTLPFGMTFLKFNPLVLALTLGILFAFISVSFICLLNPRMLQILVAILPARKGSKLEGKLSRLAQAITAYSGQRGLLLGAVGLGFLVHFLTTLMYFCTAMAIRTEGIRMAHILFACPIMIYGTVIGPSISGEGIREAIPLFLLGKFFPPAQVALFSHLGWWAGESWGLIGGLILMLRPAGYRPRIDLSLMGQGALKPLPPLPEDKVRYYRRAIFETAAAAVGGALLGGALTGLLEASYIVWSSKKLLEAWVFTFAWIAHGFLGLGAGAGLAGVVAFAFLLRGRPWAPRRVFGFSAAAAFAVIAYVFGRFILIRDFLGEQKPSRSDEFHFALLILLCFAALRYGLSALAGLKPFRALPRLKGAALAFLGVLAVCLTVGWIERSPEPSPPAPKPAPPELKDRPSVLLICIDTLRADHLGCYGSLDCKTPAIDSLAADGVLYEKAIAQASWTRSSISTLLTGLYPSTHGAARKADTLGPKVPTLAQTLRQAGIFTAGLVNNFNIGPLMGLDLGFDHYIYLMPHTRLGASESATRLLVYEKLRQKWQKWFEGDEVDVLDYYHPAEEVSPLAEQSIGKIKSVPFFFFLHYMDPHDPYMIHPLSLHRGYARLAFGDALKGFRDDLHTAYCGEIEYCDEHIGKLLTYLKKEGLYDKMTIILTADHGEEFLDHGGWWHGRTLYEEMIHVPLIVKLPGNRHAGTRTPQLARLLDIAPTVCDLLGVARPDFMQGAALTKAGEPADPKIQRVFSEEDFEGNVLQSAREAKWKLSIANEGNPRGLPAAELFDLDVDPGESMNRQFAPAAPADDLRLWIVKTQREAEEAGQGWQ